MIEETKDFLKQQLDKIREGENKPPIQLDASAKPEDNKTGFFANLSRKLSGTTKGQDENQGREDRPSPTGRHSIKSCPCEKCQEKRVALAREFGITSDNMESPEDETIFDAETVGKILTSYHAYKQLTLAKDFPEISKVWEVATETQNAFGTMGDAILRKWLRMANFKYKQELVLGCFLLSDIGIRTMHERKLLIIEEEELKGEADKRGII